MLLITAAIVLGVLLGLVLGGSLRALADLRFRWWPLAFLGLALQVVPVPSMEGQADRWIAVGLLLLSYVVLLAFVAINFRLPGFPLLALGFCLNLLVIAVNGGMPVSEAALRRANGPRYSDSVLELQQEGGAKHHLERPDDVLMPLADVIPIAGPVGQVFSIGDLVFLAAIVWVLAAATNGLGPRRGIARRGWPFGDEGPAGLLPTGEDSRPGLATRGPPPTVPPDHGLPG